jgi:hypothetical protein
MSQIKASKHCLNFKYGVVSWIFLWLFYHLYQLNLRAAIKSLSHWQKQPPAFACTFFYLSCLFFSQLNNYLQVNYDNNNNEQPPPPLPHPRQGREGDGKGPRDASESSGAFFFSFFFLSTYF